jgi:hypothetical protein
VRKPGSGRPTTITNTMLKVIKKSLAEDPTLKLSSIRRSFHPWLE